MKSKNPWMVHLGKTLRYYRRIKKLSQEELAAKAGLDQTYITSVETGSRNISGINLIRICKVLNIEVGLLFPAIRDVSL